MKKFLSYILISTVMVANLLAPFSVRVGDNYLPKVERSEVNAENKSIILNLTAGNVGSAIKVIVDVKWGYTSWLSSNQGVIIRVTGSDGFIKDKEASLENIEKDENGLYSQIGEVIFDKSDGIKPNTTYQVSGRAVQATQSISNIILKGAAWAATDPDISSTGTPSPEFINVTTGVNSSNETTQEFVQQGTQKSSYFDALPECTISPKTWFTGCAIQALYYIFFVPTSFFFALTGMFFDATFAYSVNSASYDVAFVTQGWGIVRDICNMFFIFVLLYIAFSTILETHGFNTKKTIINVIIIGLLINFSLFAVRVIVDASNIMARVFYNSDAIKITRVDGVKTSNLIDKANDEGIISISAAIVNKINPQSLIIRGIENKVNVANDSSGIGNTIYKNGVSNWNFLVLILLSTLVNVVGIIVFLSVGLLFVTRVVGLWIAMILSPLAFFTYIIPSWSKQKMIGWENWWPDTLKMAFLAPIFIFFMYIILQFMDTGLGLFDAAKEESNLTLVLAVIIPFAFIMILLWQAKKIATDMSGSMGQSITKGIAAAGGLALGGAALGAAALGRGVIGGAVKGMAGSKWNDHKLAFDKQAEDWEKANKEKREAAMKADPKLTADEFNKKYKKPTWESYISEHNDKNPNDKIKKEGNVFDQWGYKLNQKKKGVNEIDHARHITDEFVEKSGFKGRSYNNLTAQEKRIVLDRYAKENSSKFTDEAELEYRRKNGLDRKGSMNEKEEEDFRKEFEKEFADKKGVGKTSPGFGGTTKKELTDSEKEELKTQIELKIKEENEKRSKEKLPDLSVDDRRAIKSDASLKAEKDFKKEVEHAGHSVGLLNRTLSDLHNKSFDIRNISQIKADKRDGGVTKTAAFLTSAIASGIRMGFKNSGVDYGVGQKDFLTDLKNTLTDALKNIKVEVPKASGGGDHGGGGHGGGDHGGGGHH